MSTAQVWPTQAPDGVPVDAVDLITSDTHFHIQINGIRIASFDQAGVLDGTRWVDEDDDLLHEDCVPRWEAETPNDSTHALARKVDDWADDFHIRNGHAGAGTWCTDEECRSLRALTGRNG